MTPDLATTRRNGFRLTAIFAVILLFAPPAWAHAQPQAQVQDPPKPEPKPATAATLAGKWTVNINNPNGSMQMSLELKDDPKDAKKITGTISGQMSGPNPQSVEGEVVDGKLSFGFQSRDVAVAFTGTLQKDGSLAGTMDYGRGPINWTATRDKK